MRNVMIVDDEALVRIGLQSIIEWESRGYRIAGVFKNGAEAIAAAGKEAFDIVLTDIRMPGMDGFELIRELKRLDPGMKFIILSSYSDYEYTRQAIQAGVTDYISKYEMEPVELLRVLDALTFDKGGEENGPGGTASSASPAEIRLEALAEEKARLTGLPSERLIAGMKTQFPEIVNHLAALGGSARWICFKPLPRETEYSSTERKAMGLQAEEIFLRLERLELFGEHDGLFHGACATAYEETEEESLNRLMRTIGELKDAWAKNLNIELVVGIGPEEAPERMGSSRKEAERAVQLCFYEGAGVFLHGQSEMRTRSEQEWMDIYKQAKNEIEFLHFEELGEMLARRLEDPEDRLLPEEWLRTGEMIATHLMNLLLERYELDQEAVRSRIRMPWPLNETIRKAGSRKEFLRLMRELLLRAQEAVSTLQMSRGWIAKVKEYVESRYGQPIRLEDAAETVNFSPSHFSQRFRQETGEVFSDYLTRVRIREAIRLYQETDFSTEEIAARVGYLNPNYFIKVFKKTTGQTVKQFKQRS
ncbi:response regulator [Cohnella boryungensis]|uniref:Response regulator n=1 Tax=Cohnella boryungensis TaxID=768479 RepID=A0ABV8SHX9_9BACL